MKKIFCTILAVMLVVVAFAGCRPRILEEQPTDYPVNIDVDRNTEATLRILVPTTDGGMEEAYINALTPGFQEMFPHVEIELDRRAISDDRYVETIASIVASDEIPDLFYANTVFYYYLVSRNCVRSLEPYYAAEEARYNETNGEQGLSLETDYYESFFNMSMHDGNRYIVPRSMDSVVTYYNTEFLQAAGISLDDERLESTTENPFTWDDLMSLSKEVSDFILSDEGRAAGYNNAYAIQADFDWEAVFNAVMVSYGSEAFDENGNVAIDSEETRAMANMLRDAYNSGRIFRSNTSGSSFANGMCAFHFSSSGPSRMAVNETIADCFNALPFPLIGENPAIGCGFAGWGISATASDTNRDLAWQFLKYMISEEGQMALINAGLATPSIRIDLAEEKQWSKGFDHINLDAWLQWDQYKVSSQFFVTQDPSHTFDIYSALQVFMRNLVDPYLTGSEVRSVDMCIQMAEEALTEAIS